MKKIIQILGYTILVALLVSACGLLGGDEDNDEIRLRLSNQTGYDLSSNNLSIGLGDSNAFERFDLEFSDLNDGELSEYKRIPIDPNIVVGYSINLTSYFEVFGVYLDFFLPNYYDYEGYYDFERMPPITSGNYTYLLEFTSRDFLYYTITQDEAKEEGVQIRIENVSARDYEQVSIWLPDPEDPYGQEFEIGALNSGELSGYELVNGAIQFTRIRVVTEMGDTLDNEPLMHFGTDLPPGDYTYHADIKTDNLHDNSRIVKD